jgi:hypothetical protein
MATLRDFVRRFRPAGSPGAAAPAGVPADRGEELAAELAPMFEALREVGEEAADLVGAARREAERRRAAAVQRAQQLLGDARHRADVVRAAAATEAVQAAVGERAALLDGARRDAEQVSRRAADQLTELVDRVVATIRAPGVDPGPAL